MNITPTTYAHALLEVHRAKKLDRPAERRFFELVRRENRSSWIPDIIRRFAILRDRHGGRTRVRIIAARKEVKKIIPQVKRKFGRKTRVEFVVTLDLIGGVQFFINDQTFIDASVKHQLDNMFSKSESRMANR